MSHTSTSREEHPYAVQCPDCAGYLECGDRWCRRHGVVHFPPEAGALGSGVPRVRCDCDGYPRVLHREEFRT